ncbi:MAG: hypothetical protein E6Q43_04260 [Dokdonella sp.]|nr:MAG: hypothetical protein E6Q43_04260 [Dokdonella sp.]
MNRTILLAQPCASKTTGRLPYQILAAAVTSACASLGYAQDPAPETSLSAVTVTATRSEATIDTVPQSVTVVRREEIEQQVGAGSGLGDGINNLLNKQYHNTFAQTVVTPGVYGNVAYAAASGATLHATYKHAW